MFEKGQILLLELGLYKNVNMNSVMLCNFSIFYSIVDSLRRLF